MTPTATYIAEENCLQEESHVEKPVEPNPEHLRGTTKEYKIRRRKRYEREVADYNAHLATLRKIPCSPEPGFKGGEKYTEGVDYEIKGADEWKWCYQLKGNIFAAPIVSVKGEPDMPNLILTAFQNEPVTFLLSNALRHLTQDKQRQLCNALQERLPVPVSITDEAAKLYPDIPEAGDDGDRTIERGVYITCARQYMGEISTLKEVRDNLWKCFETEKNNHIHFANECEKLQAENSKMRKALEEIQAEKRKPGEYVDRWAFNRCWHIATEALK